MTRSPVLRTMMAIALLILFIACGAPAVSGFEAVMGETIPLSGYSYGSNWAYLYLTGPNLPVNGVMLNDVTRRADQGSFTKVAVDGNDYWSYKWNTANVGGKLDEGTYTIWVVNGPNDRSHLDQADYQTISVTLGQPYLAVNTIGQQNGALELTSEPAGARVTVNNQYRGTTPITISDLPAGTYQVTFSHTGYYEFNTPVSVVAGRVSEVKATLAALPEPTTVIVTPTVALTTMAEPSPAKTPTAKASGMLPAVVLTGFVITGILHRRD